MCKAPPKLKRQQNRALEPKTIALVIATETAVHICSHPEPVPSQPGIWLPMLRRSGSTWWSASDRAPDTQYVAAWPCIHVAPLIVLLGPSRNIHNLLDGNFLRLSDAEAQSGMPVGPGKLGNSTALCTTMLAHRALGQKDAEPMSMPAITMSSINIDSH